MAWKVNSFSSVSGMSISFTGSIVLVLGFSFLLVRTCRQPAGETLRRRCWKYLICALLVLGAYLCCWNGLMIWYRSTLSFSLLSSFSLSAFIPVSFLPVFQYNSLLTTQKIKKKNLCFFFKAFEYLSFCGPSRYSAIFIYVLVALPTPTVNSSADHQVASAWWALWNLAALLVISGHLEQNPFVCFLYMGVEPKIWDNPPNHPFVHRVWNHYFHHPFWGTIIFGNTHMDLVKFSGALYLIMM